MTADASRPFDRALVRQRRARAAAGFASFNFLKAAMAEMVTDRLADVARRFDLAIDLGAQDGTLAAQLPVARVIRCDLAAFAGLDVVADEEALPFADGCVDLVVAAGGLHWVNDLPGALIQINHALKPDGLFIGALLGGDTLWELRQSLLLAEEELSGGAALRVSPFLEVRDGGGLLQRAGFAMPVADIDRIVVDYATPFALLKDLRGMGETSALNVRARTPLRRAVLLRAMELYAQRHARPDGRIPATFSIVTLSGWSPGPDQPKPLRPGSAKARLADALGVAEQPLK
jgi:SAM-dependent methyltransferase